MGVTSLVELGGAVGSIGGVRVMVGVRSAPIDGDLWAISSGTARWRLVTHAQVAEDDALNQIAHDSEKSFWIRRGFIR
jgi:hypothetical protein